MSFSFADFEILDFLRSFQRNRPQWKDDAACSGDPIEWFYPRKGQAAFIRHGLAKCSVCPVRKECFLYAMGDNPEELQDVDGVWGGSVAKQRVAWIGEGLSGEEAWTRMMLDESRNLSD